MLEIAGALIALLVIVVLACWLADKVDDYLWACKRHDAMTASHEHMAKVDQVSARLRSATDPADQQALIKQLQEL